MDITKLEKQLAREQARQREAARKAQALGAKITSASRNIDKRRKILMGVWAIWRAERSAEFQAQMQREMDAFTLVRDDDRKLFGLEPFSREEKTRRGLYGPRGSKNTQAQDAGVASAPTKADAPAQASSPALAARSDERHVAREPEPA